MKNITCYLLICRLKFKSMRTYLKDFLISSISFLSFNIIGFVLVWIMISSFGGVKDWEAFEVMFLYALNLAAFAIASCFFQNACYNLPEMIQTGDFDQVVTKPISSFVFYFSSRFGYTQLPHLVLGLCVVVLSCVRMNIKLNFYNVSILLIVIISGAIILGAMFIISTVPTFWLVQSNAIFKIVLAFRSFIRFPLSIYSKFIQMLLTFVIPYAFVNYYPAQMFFDNIEYLIFKDYIIYFSPIVAFIWMSIAIVFWNIGIKHYKSTGS